MHIPVMEYTAEDRRKIEGHSLPIEIYVAGSAGSAMLWGGDRKKTHADASVLAQIENGGAAFAQEITYDPNKQAQRILPDKKHSGMAIYRMCKKPGEGVTFDSVWETLHGISDITSMSDLIWVTSK